MSNFTKISIRLFVYIFIFASISNATVMWTDPNGSAGSFSWANGQSANGLFGDPTIAGETLTFSPSGFRAEVFSDNTFDIVSDTLSFEIMANQGSSITGIIIGENGDYSVLGDAYVRITSNVVITDLDTNQILFDDFLEVIPGKKITFGNGSWQASGGDDALQATNIKVELTNQLMAVAGNNDPFNSAWIEKKEVGDSVAITIIPEPATIAILALGVVLLGRKK